MPAIGGALVIAGLLIPSDGLLVFLRGSDGALRSDLLLGAILFKGSLVLLGIAAATASYLPLWQPLPRPSHGPPGTTDRRYRLAVVVLLVLAAAMRLYQLNGGLWLDEILTYVTYMQMSFGQNVTTFDSQNQHFLYSLLAHAAYRVLGENATAARLPAALFGVASIWAMYALGKRVAGPREGLLSAALLAVSYHHVWYSQTARGYSGLLFWTLLSGWLLLGALRAQRPSTWMFYAASVALGAYTHMTMLFVAAGQLAVWAGATIGHGSLAPRSRTDVWRGLVLGFGLSGLLTLQLYALVLPQFFGGSFNEVSVVAEWKSPIWTLLEVIRGVGVSGVGGVLLVPALLVFGLGFLSYARREPAIVTLLVIPVILSAGVNLALGHHLWPRFFFFALGFAVLVAVRGLMETGAIAARALRATPARGVTAAQLGTALAAVGILLSMRSLQWVYAPKQDFVGAEQFVERNMKAGDAAVAVGLAKVPYQSLYAPDWDVADSRADLETIRGRSHETWVVSTLPEVLDAVSPDIQAALDEEFTLAASFPGTLNDGTVFVFRSEPPASGRVTAAAPAEGVQPQAQKGQPPS